MNMILILLTSHQPFHFLWLFNFCLCFSGTYCPTGSSQPLACSLGQYCEIQGLAAPTGDCSEGYFCNGSASIPNPVLCSKGYYCSQGTTSEIACAPGTFSGNKIRNIQIL